ncbi:MAG TPA: lipid IV(A) 3-deoxy-D-manno-octulosonic acid transferase [Steroidobacteraceae bacterium]|nr:lipid IV(A) 3-deoxy-D-manno-octulosonic acid transferase [Steroidobacteraceae bacterium]
MRFLYILAVYLAAPLVSVLMLWRGLRDRSYWHNFGERFGFGPRLAPAGIWVHAVSVGEVQASAALVNTLRERYPSVPVVVTTLTPTGAERARALFKDRAQVCYIPFDLPGAVRRFFKRVQPRLAVIFETELWPNLYHECGRRRVPLVLASARISPRSVSRYSKLGSLFRDALSRGIVIAAQAEGDAERFRSLGSDPDRTHVTGNIKFDFSVPADTAERGAGLREFYAASRPMWVAGSTHAGEEEIILEAHRVVRATHPRALLALVPRHPPRFDEVAQVMERNGVRFVRRSQKARERAGSAAATADVLLVDTLGELLDFYAAADVAFVGGSLVPIGGHNLLEPAALAKPILTGPHNSNSEDIARLLVCRGAAEVVNDADSLGGRVVELLSDPQECERRGRLGQDCIDSNRGALAKLLGLIEPLLRG